MHKLWFLLKPVQQYSYITCITHTIPDNTYLRSSVRDELSSVWRTFHDPLYGGFALSNSSIYQLFVETLLSMEQVYLCRELNGWSWSRVARPSSALGIIACSISARAPVTCMPSDIQLFMNIKVD